MIVANTLGNYTRLSLLKERLRSFHLYYFYIIVIIRFAGTILKCLLHTTTDGDSPTETDRGGGCPRQYFVSKVFTERPWPLLCSSSA